jgi:HD-like signal output (HDOD) protein
MSDQILEQKQKKTKLILSNVYNLPSMSQVMMEVSNMLDNPTTNAAKLGQMIGKDQGLATKILSIANSPLYGLPRKVITIDFAILIVGYQDIKNIVIALSMIESFKNKTDKYLDQKEFWMHSLITGNASKRIAEDLGFRIGSEAFVSGLLHDLGILVVHKYFHTDFIEIVNKAVEEGNYLQIETNQLGYNHQTIGKFLAEKWNLPLAHCNTIANHHQPHLAEESKVMASVVHLADYATQKLNIGKFYWDNGLQLDESVLEILKFESIEAVDKFILGYKNLFQKEIETLQL